MALPCHRKLQHSFLLALAIALLAAPAARAQSGAVRPALYDDTASRQRAQLVSQAHQAGMAQASHSRVVQTGYVPRHQRMGQGRPVQGRMISQEEIQGQEMPYDMHYEGEYFEGEVYHEGGYGGGCGCGGGGCDGCCGMSGCGQACGPRMKCMPMCCIPVPCFTMENFSVWTGAVGYKGPLNLGVDGSFGFSYGFNWGGPAPFLAPWGIGMQFGVQGVSTDFSGSALIDSGRDQLFVTAGLFRRVDCGLQGGIAWDYMTLEWGDDVAVTQIRYELSWINRCGGEWGAIGTWGDREDIYEIDGIIIPGTTAPINATYNVESIDYFAGFYRRQFCDCNGGEGRAMAGFTQYGDAFLSAEVSVPINCKWALEGGFTYMIPDDDNNNEGRYDDEAWNVGVRLVWYPCGTARGACGPGAYYRPLFDVGDNGSVLTRALGDN